MTVPTELASMVAGNINIRVISNHCFELLCLALSIKTETVTASVILHKRGLSSAERDGARTATLLPLYLQLAYNRI